MESFASLQPEAIKAVEALEADLGVRLIAYTAYANLSEDALKAINKLESELGVTLVAY
ncbi:MAG: hypothetical protein FWG10_01020 [Eubacteriaceae bacterium]|nr:hypothetical protein [Eubacteriaceae bacterium]